MVASVLTFLNVRRGVLVNALAAPMGAVAVPAGSSDELLSLMSRATSAQPLVIVDTEMLAPGTSHVGQAVRRLVSHASGPRVIVIVANAEFLLPEDVHFFEKAGAHAVLPNVTAARWAQTGAPLVKHMVDALGAQDNSKRYAPILRSLTLSEAQTTSVARSIAAVESHSIDLAALAAAMRTPGGLEISDRQYHFRTYPECFLGSSATGWIANHLSISRERAVIVGQALIDGGLAYHVAREQPFADADNFFRLTTLPPNFSWTRFVDVFFGDAGVEIRDRLYHAKNYSDCFVGSEAHSWMIKQGLSVNATMSIGQRMIDLSIIHHVTDEHPFRNDSFFYRGFRHEAAKATARTQSGGAGMASSKLALGH